MAKPKSANKVSFNVNINVPQGCTYVRSGVVATNKTDIRTNVNIDNADYVKVASKGTAKTKSMSYTWTKTGVDDDQPLSFFL